MPYKDPPTGLVFTKDEIEERMKTYGWSRTTAYRKLRELYPDQVKRRKRGKKQEKRCSACGAPVGWRRAVGLANRWLREVCENKSENGTTKIASAPESKV